MTKEIDTGQRLWNETGRIMVNQTRRNNTVSTKRNSSPTKDSSLMVNQTQQATTILIKSSAGSSTTKLLTRTTTPGTTVNATRIRHATENTTAKTTSETTRSRHVSSTHIPSAITAAVNSTTMPSSPISTTVKPTTKLTTTRPITTTTTTTTTKTAATTTTPTTTMPTENPTTRPITPPTTTTETIHLHRVYKPSGGGRIGNQLFEYASAYGIARMNNRTAVTHESNYNTLWNVFPNLSLPRSKPLPNMHSMSEAKYGTYDKRFEKLPKSNVQLNGYFQSWKYFHRYEDELRTEFSFNKNLSDKATDYLRQIALTYNELERNITFVGVHVRRADRVTSQLYRVAPLSYIVKAMADFRANFTRVHFVVCSDDMSWCKNNLGQQKNVSFSEGRTANVDFAILSSCNHTLSTVGTFSWWVGWLAGGTTTYYTNHANVSTYMYQHLTFADFFLPNWIPMSD